MSSHYLFTSESVTEGHPDKVCDQISDAILDEIIMNDPNCRVACETAITRDTVMIMGEITSKYEADIPEIARNVLLEIGYNNIDCGFDSNKCDIITLIENQSTDIAIGVDTPFESKSDSRIKGYELGAGDQGMVFGYACDETPELMPLPLSVAHNLAIRLSKVRKSGELDYLMPDGKTQVTVEYVDGVPSRIDTIIISAQHSPSADSSQIYTDILNKIIFPTIPEKLIDKFTKIYINPTGRFVLGGPQADTGLTGRKIIIDTYGGSARHGGGAFSGKDPTKVDRSAAYAARYIAKNIVAAGIASKCEVQISYAIGLANPISVMVDTYGTGSFTNEKISEALNKVFDLRPSAIIKQFDLLKPIYQELATYGHMGREDLNVLWEKTDKIDELKQILK